MLYSKSKESNGSKKVVIEEIEIPLDEQHENIDNKKTEKNLISSTKSKILNDEKDEKMPVKNQNYIPQEKSNNRYSTHNQQPNSERIASNPSKSKLHEHPVDNKRKPSDYIIKKGKVHNLASNNSKSASPAKHGQSSDEPTSS